MKALDIILIILVAAGFFFSLFSLMRSRKKSGCSCGGCSGDCGGCTKNR